MQVLDHATDDSDENTKLNTINLSLKSMMGEQKTRFQNIMDVSNNNRARIEVITEQLRLLRNVLTNLERIVRSVIAVDRAYYQMKYRDAYRKFNNLVNANGMKEILGYA